MARLRDTVIGVATAVGSALASVALLSKGLQRKDDEQGTGVEVKAGESVRIKPDHDKQVNSSNGGTITTVASTSAGPKDGSKSTASKGADRRDRSSPILYGGAGKERIAAEAHKVSAEAVIPHVEPQPGWGLPKPDEIPQPTYWPVVLAVGITFIFWGLISTLVITAVGLVIFAMALAGWLGDIRHENAGH